MKKGEARLLLLGLGWRLDRHKKLGWPVVVLLLAVLLTYLLAAIAMLISK